MSKKVIDTTVVPIERSEEIKAAVAAVRQGLYMSDCVGCLLIAEDNGDGSDNSEFRIYPDHTVTYQVRDADANVVGEPRVIPEDVTVLTAIFAAVKGAA